MQPSRSQQQRLLLLLLLLLVACCWTQEIYNEEDSYQEYADPYGPNDNLYADYAARQEMKDYGGGGGGIGMGKFLAGSALSWFLGGKVHSTRVSKKIKNKHQREQKALYAQYYNDVYKLSETNDELKSLVRQLQDALKQTEAAHELEALQRDYDEFTQPDIDGDDRISRAEFNMYVKNYLSNYPGLSEDDYPKFEDFDHDGDGYVSFKEYADQMALQTIKAEKKMAAQQETTTKTTPTAVKNAAHQKLDGIYNQYY